MHFCGGDRMTSEDDLDRLERQAQLLVEALDRDARERRNRDRDLNSKLNYLRESNLRYEERRKQEEKENQALAERGNGNTQFRN
jgi:hypothetical protein